MKHQLYYNNRMLTTAVYRYDNILPCHCYLIKKTKKNRENKRTRENSKNGAEIIAVYQTVTNLGQIFVYFAVNSVTLERFPLS